MPTVKADAVPLATLAALHGCHGGVAEYRFHPVRQWRFDLAWPDPAIKLAVEKDGGLFGRGKACPVCRRRPVGAHSSIGQQKKDREKFNAAVLLGWRVLHFWPDQINDGSAWAVVREALAQGDSRG